MPDADTYTGSAPTNPAGHAIALPDSTTTELAEFSRGIYVGGDGNLVVKMGLSSSFVTFAAVPAGSLLPIRISEIDSTSTATNVVAIY